LFSTILSAQQQLTGVFLRHHLADRYHRIDSMRPSGLELISPSTVRPRTGSRQSSGWPTTPSRRR
jgi:hypothetical protein